MSEKDVHLEPEEGQHTAKDEDVEAHHNKNSHLNRNTAKDDDDVEAHHNKNSHLNRNTAKDDDDDVEAHRNLNQNKF